MSKLTALTKLPSEDRELVKMQANVEQAIAPLAKMKLLGGILLEPKVLKIGSNTIEHKLLRQPNGYIMVSNSGPASFYDNILTSADKLSFTLNSSAAITVTIYVF